MRKAKMVLLGLILAVGLLLAGCGESFERGMKNFRSEYGGGLDRVVTVYSHDGKILRQLEGRLDVQPSAEGGKVLFELDGKRYIYYHAIVAVEEK